tara:strand:+ start:120 stop:569 length:450 start_codon:yes stop_codon:yes gene_type:complete
MIINCPSCEKKFELDGNLIPDKGRLLMCGFCDHTWFFNKNTKMSEINPVQPILKKPKFLDDKKNIKESFLNENKAVKGSEIIEYNSRNSLTFNKFLSYILVILISFIGFLILIDTFRLPLYKIFPNLEFFLFSFYEILIDIKLFINDLI